MIIMTMMTMMNNELEILKDEINELLKDDSCLDPESIIDGDLALKMYREFIHHLSTGRGRVVRRTSVYLLDKQNAYQYYWNSRSSTSTSMGEYLSSGTLHIIKISRTSLSKVGGVSSSRFGTLKNSVVRSINDYIIKLEEYGYTIPSKENYSALRERKSTFKDELDSHLTKEQRLRKISSVLT